MSVPRPRLFARRRAIDPEVIESAIMGFTVNHKPVIVDVAVTATGKKEDRRIVAYLVLKKGYEREEIEDELETYLKNRGLKVWQRPRAYSQVIRIPRDRDGNIQRRLLRRGVFRDGRRFMVRSPVRREGQIPKPQTVLIRKPVNEIRFEGVVALPPRRKDKDVVLSVSHQAPGSSPLRISFLFNGKLRYQVEKLEPGTRVSVAGTLERLLRFRGVDFTVINPEKARQKRVELADTDGLLERLL